MNRLFSDDERTSTERYLPAQSVMKFLENTANPKMAVAREKIQELFDRYVAEAPPEEINRIHGSLLAREENQFFEAYFELFMFDYLKALGIEVSIAPSLTNSAKRISQPDFRLTEKDGSITYLEATVLNEKIEIGEHEGIQILHWMKGRFERLKNAGFDLFFQIEEDELYYPESNEVYHEKEELYQTAKKWHGTLDHSAIRREIESIGKPSFADCPKFVGYLGSDQYDFIKITIEAWPMSYESMFKNSGNLIQAKAGATMLSVDIGKLSSKCGQKTSKQHPGLDLYLANLVPHKYKYYPDFILSDLYGNDRISGRNRDQIDIRSSICKDESVFIRRDGTFRNENVEGIILFYDIFPWAPGIESCELYLHPSIGTDYAPKLSADWTFRRIGEAMMFDRERIET